MPTRLTLHVINAADVPVRPPLDALGGVALPDWFRQATDGEVQLDVVEHRTAATSSEIDGAGLQAIFREFVSSPPPGQLASDIALLFCRSWCFHDLAGLMFDYDGADLPAGARVVFDGVPRQGCAVFLDSQPAFSPADHLYVAVHELGHVFNLQHDLQGGSFMGFDVDAARSFREVDRARLKAAGAGKWPEQHECLPGGAPFHTGAGFPGAAFHCPARRGRRVAVALGQRSFLPGEPVVMDVSVSLPAGSMAFGAGLEPGYDGVRVWYRTPSGEVRLFAPIRRYCPMTGRRGARVQRSRRLANNMRIHLTRRGFALIDEGTYQVWVEVDVQQKGGRVSTLVSRGVTFEIRRPENEYERAVSAALADPRIARFVANKGGPLDATRMQALQDLSRDSKRIDPAVSHVRYALAWALHKEGRDEEAWDHIDRVRFALPSLAGRVRKLAKAVRNSPGSSP